MENRLLVRRKFRHKTGPLGKGQGRGLGGGGGWRLESSIGFGGGITFCFPAALRDQQGQRVPWQHGWSQLRWQWQNVSLTFQLTVVCVRQLRGLWDLRLWRRYSWGLGIWRRVVWCLLPDDSSYRGAFIFRCQPKVLFFFFNISGEWTTIFRNVKNRPPTGTESHSSRHESSTCNLMGCAACYDTRKVLEVQATEI
jgi:hypothetical protein